MANKYRGEIDATLDGAAYTLCLTLGALAELETSFGTDDMLSLSHRFANGRISATDCVRIIGAGLRAAGHDVRNDAVATMGTENGAAGFVDIVARLLAATFGGPIAGAAAGAAISAVEADMTATPAAPMAKAEPPEPTPFPWPEVMAAGLGALALPPHVFWGMTLKEIDAALRGRFGTAREFEAPARHDLEALMKLFPDEIYP